MASPDFTCVDGVTRLAMLGASSLRVLLHLPQVNQSPSRCSQGHRSFTRVILQLDRHYLGTIGADWTLRISASLLCIGSELPHMSSSGIKPKKPTVNLPCKILAALQMPKAQREMFVAERGLTSLPPEVLEMVYHYLDRIDDVRSGKDEDCGMCGGGRTARTRLWP